MTLVVSANAHTITAADGTIIAVPDEFVCPLTLDVMREPYLSREGHNYERDAIMKWVTEYGSSPLTREKLLPVHLCRNRALEMKIRLFLLQNGVLGPLGNKQDIKPQSSDQETMSLHDLTASTLQTRSAISSGIPSNDPVSEEQLAERRRQIADLIGSAMSELDDF